MSGKPVHRFGARQLVLALCLCLALIYAWHNIFPPAQAAQLGNRSMKLSSDEISATTDYLLSFELSTAGPLGSMVVQFCSNDPIPGDPCSAPTGFDASAAVLADQTGPTGFSISNASTANKLILTRAPVNAPVGAASYHFTGMVNPSLPGSYYIRVQTFATNNASGAASDYGGIAIAILNNVAISAEVPPYLIFCTGVTISGLNCANATGDYIDFGELSAQQASSGSSQMLVATNAESGYGITVIGTTLSSGNNAIAALAPADVSRPGVAQFGFNLRSNTTPPDGANPIGPGVGAPAALYDQPNIYRFVSGDTIATNNSPADVREFTASYIVNRPIGQAPGIYVSTLTYVCLATF